MDTTRWKSILVPREVYEEIKKRSKEEGRTIGGQLRIVCEWYTNAQRKKNDLEKNRKESAQQAARRLEDGE